MNEPAAAPPKPKPARPMALLEARARHLLLMSGLGFLAVVSGNLIANAFSQRAHERLLAAGSPAVLFIAGTVLSGFWVLVVLPGLVYICCRFLELKPLTTSIVAAVTGELFMLAIPIAAKGLDQLLADVVPLVTQLGTMVAGILISVSAGKRAKIVAARAEADALERAKARKSQYDDFLKQAEAFADKRAANPIAPAAPPPAAPEQPAAPPPADPPKPS